MMTKRKQLSYIALVLVGLLLVLSACRRGEEEALPTSVPTAVVPEAAAPDEVEVPTVAPTAVAVAAQPTATPEPAPLQAIAPEDIDWPPQVIGSSPAPGQETRLDGAITVRFDQPMAQASVEDAFAVTALDDDTAVAGLFSWPRPDTVVFTPETSFRRAQNYRVHIDENAMSRNGRALADPVELDLQTVGLLDVSQVIPPPNAADVQADGAITVLFNRPVVPLVATGQQADLPQPLQVTPPLAGSGEWVSTSIYRFEPDPAFDGATTYDVTIAAGLEDVTGGILEQDFRWQFTTMRPAVVSVEPGNLSTDIRLDSTITVTFNMPMDRAMTEAAIALGGSGAPATDLTFEWSDGDRVVALRPPQGLALGVEYVVSIDQSARAALNDTTLAETTTSRFDTVLFPAVVGTRPNQGEIAERYQRGFSILFASPMDLDTLEDRLIIEPVPGEVDYFFNDFNFELFVNFESERNTEYRITVPSDAADPYGNTLGERFVFTFRTPGFDPLASFNLPPRISQLSTSFVTQVDVIHRNLSRAELSLYDLGLPLTLISEPFQLSDYQPISTPDRTWQLEPEAAQDEVGLISVPLADGRSLATGIYLLLLDAPETPEDARFWQNQRHLLLIADTNVVVKELFGEVYVWVTDLASGEPAPGLELNLYNQQGVSAGTAVSDASGFVRFDYSPPDNFLPGVTVVAGQPGASSFGVGSTTWDGGPQPFRLGLDYSQIDEAPIFTYLYTDRPIYRPGDTVYFKGIVRQANYGRYTLPEPRTIPLRLSPAFFFEEGMLEETIEVSLAADGSFEGQYTLPEDARLGRYQLNVPDQSFDLFRVFSVAEYRAPEFQVNLTPDRTEALRGESVDVELAATFFFGGAATDLAVRYFVYEDAYRPDIPGPFYAFGDDGGFFYRDQGPFAGFGGGGEPGNLVWEGTGRTGADGRLTITLPADLLAEVEAGSRRITVEATVIDETKFSVTSRTELILHAAELYVGVVPSDYLVSRGAEGSVDVRTVDWEGRAVASQDVEVVFYRRNWERRRDAEFGSYRTVWIPVDSEVARVQLTTDGQGEGVASFVPERGGTYLAVATVTDEGGRSQTSSVAIWVIDSAFVAWRSDPLERSMTLAPDQPQYRPGDTAQVLVQSPFDGSVQAWVTIERGTLIDQRLVTLSGSSEVLSIPIRPEFAPNVFVSVVAVKGVEPDDADTPYADIRLGIAELVVSPEQLELDVGLTPQSEAFVPGETAVYEIEVTDHRGRGVEADLSLALVDLAVLSLKEDNAPHILDAFYARQPYRSRVGGGLFISGEGLEPEVPLEVFGFGGGGGGFEQELAVARLAGEEDEDDIRQDFPDTAFWEAQIAADANGRARVEIPLPDSLTTWRLSSKAVTTGTLVGQSSVDIVVSLPLLVRPVTPRFFTVGDTLQLGAIVNNNTDQAIETVVTLEAEGLTLAGPANQTVTVPANGRQLVRWPVTVDDVTSVELIFRVRGGGFRDATRPSFGQGPRNLIPVYRFDAEDLVSTSGALDTAGRRVEAVLLPPELDARRGEVVVELSPSLAAAIIEALDHNNRAEFSLNCAGAITDRLLPNVAVARAIQQLDLDEADLANRLERLIKRAVSRLEGLALEEGGWGWCSGSEANPLLTAYTLLALVRAEQAGYSVDPAVLLRATGYLNRQLGEPADLAAGYETNSQALFLYVLAERRQDVTAEAEALVEARRGLLDPYARALLALALDLTGRDEMRADLLADLNDSVVLSATGAHWEDASRDFRSLNSDVRGTAIVLDALARLEPDNPLAPGAVRWLMAARTAQHWTTPHETAWTIFALTDWLQATGELEADYAYALDVNGVTMLEGAFNRDSIAATESTSLPMRRLVPREVNYFNFRRSEGNGRLYYSLYLDSFVPAEQVGAVNRGVAVTRAYFDAACDPEETECQPITEIAAGQRLRVEVNIVAPNDLLFAVVEDPIPAGATAIDPGLNTSPTSASPGLDRRPDVYNRGFWGFWYFTQIDFRDEKVVFLAEFLPAGTYQYTYFLEANIPGEYQVMPAIAHEAYFPEVFGRSDGLRLAILDS